jgi:hypothetical protein
MVFAVKEALDAHTRHEAGHDERSRQPEAFERRQVNAKGGLKSSRP